MGHLLHGVHEQTHVPFAIAYSLCIGPYAKKCRTGGGMDEKGNEKDQHGHEKGDHGGGRTNESSVKSSNISLSLLIVGMLFFWDL
jgi:hypothetical protein